MRHADHTQEHQLESGLSQKGWQECSNKSNTANQLDIEIVLVSPLRRSLETAYCMLKDHPNFSQIKFILTPDSKEFDDFPRDFATMLQSYSPLFPQGLDTSMIDRQSVSPELWFLESSSSLREILATIKFDKSGRSDLQKAHDIA